MSKHFIKHIEIKNFKCFENFKAEGFGRVNLIGGKNNVGKTAFMEAVYVNVYAQTLKSFLFSIQSIKYMRENLNVLSKLIKNEKLNNLNKEFIEKSNGLNITSNINESIFNIEEKDGIKKYIFNFKDQYIDVNINEFSYEMDFIENIIFIDNFGLSNNDIITNYSAIQKKDEELYLNKILSIFDERIEVFKIIDEKPQCKVNGNYLEITEFGDGLRHLISIVTALYRCENGYLFIDEIDNGIHYTMLDKLWKIIFDVSTRLNVQVFSTTHSKESMESYNRVQKELKHQGTYYFEMARNVKTDKIFMFQIDEEQLEYGLLNNERLRGE